MAAQRSGPVDVDGRRIAGVDPRSPGGWEVPARLPEPGTSRPRELADVVLAMALEAARLRALFSGSRGPDDDQLARLVRADGIGDLGTLWSLAVPEVCAAYRVGALTAADAADRGEDDTFASLAALCAVSSAGSPGAAACLSPLPARCRRGPPRCRTGARCAEATRPARRWPPTPRCSPPTGEPLPDVARPARGMLGADMSTPLPSPDDGPRPVDVLTVASVAQVTPSVRRVTLTGDPTAVAALQPTVNVLVPRTDDPAPRWPAVARDGRIVWPVGSHGVSLRSYTARRQDLATGEVDVDFVLHGDGPAAAWAAAARPGALLGVAGSGPLGFSPAATVLLAADETALPAVTRILTEAPPGTRGLALLEVADAAEEQHLPAPDGVEIRWLHRGGTPPGGSTLLADAVAAMDRPGGPVFAWVAAESAAVRAVRADLRGRWGLTRAEHHAIGYWRRGRAMSPSA